MKLSFEVGPGGALWPADQETLDYIAAMPMGHAVDLEHKQEKKRTLTQNRALHLFLQMLADCLNDAGLTQMKVLKPSAEIPWTMETVKHCLWRPLQDAIIGEESTADAATSDYSKVYEVLCRHLATKIGVTAPDWPTRHGTNYK